MTDYEELLKKHGLCTGLIGTNENNEKVMVTITKNRAWIRTFQKNGFVRTNVYHKDGTTEELYDK